ncbi:MAG TPA: peptidoglycan DD-metalloendopeptidase family protein, partial [Luteimonas sp.]|nr:peptidoglycan DD-metalloendopeptidase family protein [Luteimonas sp.]
DKRSREKALGSNVASLKKLLAELRAAAARAEAERRAAAERARREAARTGAPPPRVTPPAGTGLRVGGVGWPLSGNLIAGYGGKLPDGGSSSGLLIGAPAGTPVKAVADGRVVFGDWMNGYGLILIVDHGNGYMSLYARNEALLRDVGDRVKRGDPVATVGNSGTAGPVALYFELRRNGDPVDPGVWLKR